MSFRARLWRRPWAGVCIAAGLWALVLCASPADAGAQAAATNAANAGVTHAGRAATAESSAAADRPGSGQNLWVARSRSSAVDLALTFDELLALHVQRYLLSMTALPEGARASTPKVGLYVTLERGVVRVWERPAVQLSDGFFPRAQLARCPWVCAPKLRDAVRAALALFHAEASQRSTTVESRVVLVADKTLPYGSLLVAAQSVAAATGELPPQLSIAVRTAPGRVGEIQFLVSPPKLISIPADSEPLLAQVEVRAGGSIVRSESIHFARPMVARTLSELEDALGDLKSRDPARSLVLISAPDDLPLETVLRAVYRAQTVFPTIMLLPLGAKPYRLTGSGPI